MASRPQPAGCCVGDRDWEVVQEKQQRIAGPTVEYKSSLPIQQILDSADGIGQVQVQETQALEMPVDQSQARTEPLRQDNVQENQHLAAESTVQDKANLALKQVLNGPKNAGEEQVEEIPARQEQAQAEPVQQDQVKEKQPETAKAAVTRKYNLTPEQMLGGAAAREEQAQDAQEQQDQAREEAQADDTDDAIIPEQTAQARQPLYRVVNGTGREEMAKRFSTFFGSKGLRVASTKNAGDYDYDVSVISYAPGYEEEAKKMAAALPVAVELEEDADLNVKVELTIGADLLAFDASLKSRMS